MDKFFALGIGFLLYGLPILWIVYTLIHYLIVQIEFHKSEASSKEGKKPFAKIILASVGILYGLFVFGGLTITMLKPNWFHPPFWLVVVLVVTIVPYVACVAGTIGLGYIGQGGVSPSTIINKAMKNLKNQRRN